jgi:hypothetical protein
MVHLICYPRVMFLLEWIGSSVNPRQLRTRLRDDIGLDKSEMPWRRLPYWLFLRVTTLGRILFILLDDTHGPIGRVYYKFITCSVLANLLQRFCRPLHFTPNLELHNSAISKCSGLTTTLKAHASMPLSWE